MAAFVAAFRSLCIKDVLKTSMPNIYYVDVTWKGLYQIL